MPAAAECCPCYQNSLVDVSVPGMSFVQKCLHCDCDIIVNSNMLDNPPVNVSVPLTPHHVPTRFLCADNCRTVGTVSEMWDHVIFSHPHAALVLEHTLSKVELEYLLCDCQLADDFFNFLMLSPFGFFMVNVRWLSHKKQLFVGIESVESYWPDWEVSLCSENNNVQINKRLVAVPTNDRDHLFAFQFKKQNCSSFLTKDFLSFEDQPKLFLKARLN